jgi:dCMP deaminase
MKTEIRSQLYSGLDFLDDIFYLENENWRISKDSETGGFHCFLDDSIHTTDKDRNRDLIYLEMASAWSKNSSCKRAQVGCLVVKNKSIISDGYNGSPSGFPNVCESEEMVTLPYVLHAEANAITKLAKSTQSSMGSTMYVTLSPCFECAKLIIQSGIKRIVFCDVYRNTEPLIFLSEGGIEITRISSNHLSKD